MVVGNAVFVNCTGNRTIVFFYSYFSNICWILLCKKGCNVVLDKTICRLFYFSCEGMVSITCIRIDLRVLAPLKMT